MEQALKDIVLAEAGLYGPVSAGEPGDTFGGSLVEELQRAAGTMFDNVLNTVIASAWSTPRSSLVTRHAGFVVDGHMAGEIIKIAEGERQRALGPTLAKYRDQLGNAEHALTTVREQIGENDRKAVEHQVILNDIRLSGDCVQLGIEARCRKTWSMMHY